MYVILRLDICNSTIIQEPRGIIPLENIRVREVTTEKNKPHCFELYSAANEVIKACKTDSEGKVVEGKKPFYSIPKIREIIITEIS